MLWSETDLRDVRRLAVGHSDPGTPGVSSLHYHIPVLHSIIYWRILHGSIYPPRIIRKLTLRRDVGHSRTRKRLSQIPRQELSELPLHHNSTSIILKRSLRAGARPPSPRSRARPASSAVAWRRCGPRVLALALVAAIPPIPLQALVAALKLITSSVWFFSHALIAARKREDVQSYTEASHSTRRCHANSYFPPSSQH